MRAKDVQKASRKRGRDGNGVDSAAQARALWLSITRRPWTTLVMLPSHEGGSALSVAYELVEAGSVLRRKPVELISAEGMDLTTASGWLFEALNGRTGPHMLEANAGSSKPERFARVVVLEAVASNMLSAPIAQAAEAVLLVIEQGVSDLASARAAMKAIGRNRIVGCALVTRP